MRDQGLIRFAKDLRERQTDTEKLLWRHLRARQFHSLKFRRQYPVGPYIADFACVEEKLIIELDGSQHIGSESDPVRTEYLESQGFVVVRFWNNDILSNISGVWDALTLALSRHREQGLKEQA